MVPHSPRGKLHAVAYNIILICKNVKRIFLFAQDTIFFIADQEERAAYYAGQIRNELGKRLDLYEKNAYRFYN